MGTKTLKQLCDEAREELGWDIPSQYVDSSEADGVQTFRIANRQGFDMSQEDVVWEELKTEKTISLVAAGQTYALPDDFRYMIPSTEWDQNADRRLSGPLTPKEWARSEHSGTVFGLKWRYEIRTGQIVFSQTIASGDAGTLISYEYVSSFWAKNVGGTAIVRFSADTDTQRLDDDIFIAGIVWRLKRAKGFDWVADAALYQDWLGTLKARDGGMRDVVFGDHGHLGVNIPETGFG